MGAQQMTKDLIRTLQGTQWKGTSELWMDPLGNEVSESKAILRVGPEHITYNWSHEGTTHTGEFRLDESGISWKDSFHQPGPVSCELIKRQIGIFTVQYTYKAGSGPNWHWRMKLSQRPDDTLVLQMTNITPWGEEGRAVRMIMSPD